MYSLWARGSLERPRRLKSHGELRSVRISSQSDSKSTEDAGLTNSALIPSPDGRSIFVFEWSDDQRICYSIQSD